jgi:hypothetical protein
VSVTIEDLQKVINEDVLPTDVADMYLAIYIADIDWKPHIAKLWSNIKNKNTEDAECKAQIKKSIACATLLPTYEKKIIPSPPQNLLFWAPTWSQYNEKDWLSLYKEIIKEDIEIRRNRKKILSLGVIDSVDYVPLTRQAFNWIYAKAEDSEVITEENKQDLIKKFQNLVKIYGGATICNLFSKHEKSIEKVLNWKSGYFIEKEIHKVYTLEQLAKIKQTELSKIDKKYIKTLIKK